VEISAHLKKCNDLLQVLPSEINMQVVEISRSRTHKETCD